jgi:hypothetical protein
VATPMLSKASPVLSGRRVRPKPASWLCYADIRLSPVLGTPPFSDSGVSGRSYAREDCGEVIVGCPVEVQDTPQGADVDGSKEANCRCPLSLI